MWEQKLPLALLSPALEADTSYLCNKLVFTSASPCGFCNPQVESCDQGAWLSDKIVHSDRRGGWGGPQRTPSKERPAFQGQRELSVFHWCEGIRSLEDFLMGFTGRDRSSCDWPMGNINHDPWSAAILAFGNRS